MSIRIITTASAQAELLIQQEFVESNYQKMLSNYPAIGQMKVRMRTGSYIPTSPSIPLRPWPCLDIVAFDKQHMSPEQMRETFNAFQNDDDALKVYFGGGFDRHFPGEWKSRCIEPPYYVDYGGYYLSHSVVSFAALGDKHYYFENPEDEYLDATVVAGKGSEFTQAFLMGKRTNGEDVIIELDDFCLLTLSNGNLENRETGLFVVFSKKHDLLYVGEIEGSPNLVSAELPLSDDLEI